MANRDEAIRLALLLARQRLANGGTPRDDLLRRLIEGDSGGFYDYYGITPPQEEEARATTPGQRTASATPRGTAAPTTPSRPSPVSAPAPAPAPAPVLSPEEQAIRNAPPITRDQRLDTTMTYLEDVVDQSMNRGAPMPKVNIDDRSRVDPVGVDPQLRGYLQSFAPAQAPGRFEARPAAPTAAPGYQSYLEAFAPAQNAGQFQARAASPAAASQAPGYQSYLEAFAPGKSPGSFGPSVGGPSAQGFSGAPAPAPVPSGVVPGSGQQKFNRLMDQSKSILNQALDNAMRGGRATLGVEDIRGGHQFPDVKGVAPSPKDYRSSVNPEDLPAVGAQEAQAKVSGISGPYGRFSNNDVEALANMIAGEASTQGREGMAQVGQVALNRAISNYNNYGSTLQAQLSRPSQFLGYNSRNANQIMAGKTAQERAVAQQARDIARGLMEGRVQAQFPDATDFNKASPSYNQARGAINTSRLGSHTFFNAAPSYANRLAKARAALQKAQEEAKPGPNIGSVMGMAGTVAPSTGLSGGPGAAGAGVAAPMNALAPGYEPAPSGGGEVGGVGGAPGGTPSAGGATPGGGTAGAGSTPSGGASSGATPSSSSQASAQAAAQAQAETQAQDDAQAQAQAATPSSPISVDIVDSVPGETAATLGQFGTTSLSRGITVDDLNPALPEGIPSLTIPGLARDETAPPAEVTGSALAPAVSAPGPYGGLAPSVSTEGLYGLTGEQIANIASVTESYAQDAQQNAQENAQTESAATAGLGTYGDLAGTAEAMGGSNTSGSISAGALADGTTSGADAPGTSAGPGEGQSSTSGAAANEGALSDGTTSGADAPGSANDGGYGGGNEGGYGGGYGGDNQGGDNQGGYGGDNEGGYGGGNEGGYGGDGGYGGGDGGDGWEQGGRVPHSSTDVVKALRVARDHSSRDKSGNALRLARGEVLGDRYPTQYLPEVGRQVMADGGVPQDDYRAERQLIDYAKELDRSQRRQDYVNAVSETWPVQLARSVISAATAPRDAYARGMETDEMVARAQDMAGAVTGGGFGFSRPSGSVGMGGRSLPPAENSRLTQIATTGPSYLKAMSNLERAGIEGRAIDYGAGRGHGLRHMSADTFEPYPQGWTPTFMRPEDIPDETYRRLVNLNVLNVLSPEAREAAVLNMGRIIAPEGGGVISTRGRDVLSAKGTPGPEPMSLIIGEGDLARYQKGFTPKELREYVGDVLGPRFDVMPSDVGQASVLFRRTKRRGGSVDMADGGVPMSEGDRNAQLNDLVAYADRLDRSARAREAGEALGQTWPVQLARSIVGGAALPRDVYEGRVDPTSEIGIQRAADLASTVMGGGMGASRPTGSVGMGGRELRAYHGSPHDFDRFDLNKIGTGTGVQRRGHGLYFAEKEPVAIDFRDRLTQQSDEWQRANDTFLSAEEKARRLATKYAEEQDPRVLAGYNMVAKEAEAAKAEADRLFRKGHMYEVNIHANPEQFLDWSRPMEQQSRNVQDIVRDLGAQAVAKKTDGEFGVFMPGQDFPYAIAPDLQSARQWADEVNLSLTGKDVYRSLAKAPEDATRALREAGVPGIRYLDPRSLRSGEGDQNYVVFDDKIIDILRKYAKGGSVDESTDAEPQRPPEDRTRVAMFAGEGAVGAPLQALEIAKQLIAKGASPEEAYRGSSSEGATGWFQGADGRWRFEISDKDSAINPQNFERLRAGEAVRPNELLSHPRLFEMYPHLNEINLGMVPQSDYDDGLMGSFNRSTNTLALPPDLRQAHSTMLHELQHGIQGNENLQTGGASAGIKEDLRSDALLKQLQAQLRVLEIRRQVMDRMINTNYADPEELAKLREFEAENDRQAASERGRIPALTRRLEELSPTGRWGSLKDYELYRRLAGETEARNVQNRMQMDLDERRETFPGSTQDYPNEEQYIRLRADGGSVVDRALMLVSKKA